MVFKYDKSRVCISLIEHVMHNNCITEFKVLQIFYVDLC